MTSITLPPDDLRPAGSAHIRGRATLHASEGLQNAQTSEDGEAFTSLFARNAAPHIGDGEPGELLTLPPKDLQNAYGDEHLIEPGVTPRPPAHGPASDMQAFSNIPLRTDPNAVPADASPAGPRQLPDLHPGTPRPPLVDGLDAAPPPAPTAQKRSVPLAFDTTKTANGVTQTPLTLGGPTSPAKPLAPSAEPNTPITPSASALVSSPGVMTSSQAAAPATQAHLPSQIATHIHQAVVSRPSGDMIEILLDPPDLGRIRLDFDFSREGNIRATVFAIDPDTHAFVRRQSDALLRELALAGLENIDIDFDGEPTDTPSGSGAMVHIASAAPVEATEPLASPPAPPDTQLVLSGIDIRL